MLLTFDSYGLPEDYYKVHETDKDLPPEILQDLVGEVIKIFHSVRWCLTHTAITRVKFRAGSIPPITYNIMTCIALINVSVTGSTAALGRIDKGLHLRYYMRSLRYVESVVEEPTLDNIVGLLWMAMYEGSTGRMTQMRYHT
ncbi:hypothetical protein EV182_003042, partial [Spiromyces aspiralis]